MNHFPLKLVLPLFVTSSFFLIIKAQTSCQLGLSPLFSFPYSMTSQNLPILPLHWHCQCHSSSHTSDVTTASQLTSLIHLYQIFLYFSPTKCSNHVISFGWSFQWVFVPIRVISFAKETRTLKMRLAIGSWWQRIESHHWSWSSYNYTRSCWRAQH